MAIKFIQPQIKSKKQLIPIMKSQVVIISDSRGARLGQELRSMFNPDVHYRVIVKSGAKLEKLWEIAESEIIYNMPNFIFLLGSVCNITDRYYDENGVRYFWPPSNIKARVDYILQTMEDIASNALMIGTHTKVCFLPENGMDINRYNGINNPIPWRNLVIQHNMERGFNRIQRKAKYLNDRMDVATPRSLEITHSRRNGIMRPVYGRLYDGLHFSRPVARRLAIIINEYANQFLSGAQHDYR